MTPLTALAIWTRSIDDWAQDQALLQLRSISMVHLPCIHLENFNSPDLSPIAKGHADVAVFTSTHAVHAAIAQPEIKDILDRASQIYCFGDKTALALSNIYPQKILRPANTLNAKDLGYYLTKHLAANTTILVLGPEKPAYDLCGYLNENEFETHYLSLYRTLPKLTREDGSVADMSFLSSILGQLPRFVCFASPSAVIGFCQAFHFAERQISDEFVAVVIGSTTRQSCQQYFQHIVSAKDQTIESLMDKVRELHQ